MFTLYHLQVYVSRLKNIYNLSNQNIRYCRGEKVKLRILEILKEKGKTKYWLYIQLGLSYQNFNKIVNNETKSIKFENLKAICDVLECTPNDLFEEYHTK